MGRSPSQLYVRDNVGGEIHHTTGDLRNIMTSDMTCILDNSGTMSGAKTSPTGKSQMNGIVLKSSSAAVVHQIDGVLNHTPLVNGRHDSTWATPTACKRYLQRFSILPSSSIQNMKRHE